MNDKNIRPAIGVATVVIKNGKILIGKDTRKWEKIYGVPWGHRENWETLKACAMRETREESGVICKNIQLISVHDFYRADKQKSYVTIGMKADYESGDLSDLVEEGRLERDWYEPTEAMKLNLFPADRILIERYLSGVIFS